MAGSGKGKLPGGISREEVTRRAVTLGLSLTERHWYFIQLVTGYYAENHTTCTLRYLVRELGADKKEIYHLFGNSPIKQICYLTGLPVPEEC